METRHIFKKKEQKSSSKHETEWDHQVPNRSLYRTSYEVIVKSSVVQKEIKVIGDHKSPLMSSNRVYHDQSDRGNKAECGKTQNGKASGSHKSCQDFVNTSLSSLSSESSTEKLKISESSSNFCESESTVVKENMAKKSGDIQPPEHLQNFDSSHLNDMAAMGVSGVFTYKFLDTKSNFYNKNDSNLFPSKDDSPKKYSKDCSPLRGRSDILINTHKNNLAGGDYINQKPETEDKNRIFKNEPNRNNLFGIFSISDKDINKQIATPPNEKSDHSKSVHNDKFVSKSFKISNKTFEDSNMTPLELQHEILIDKESYSPSCKPSTCQETKVKTRFSEDDNTQYISSDCSGLNFKLGNDKTGDTILNESYKFQKTPFASFKISNMTADRSKNFSDGDFELENNKTKKILNGLQSSDHSSVSFRLSQDFNNKQELLENSLYAKQLLSSNNAFGLFKQSKNFSLQDCNDKMSSVSSNLSRDNESFQCSMNSSGYLMNNTTSKLMNNTGISADFQTSNFEDLKEVYHLSNPITVKSRQESYSSEGGESFGFYTESSRTQGVEGSSFIIEEGKESRTKSNSYNSVESLGGWNISVRDLVEYFENFNLEAKIQEKTTKSDPFVQINFVYDGTEDINKNFLDSNKMKKNLHVEEGVFNKHMDGNDHESTFDGRQCFSDDVRQRKSSDTLLHNKKVKKIEKCDPVVDRSSNKDDLIIYNKYDFHYTGKLNETASEYNILKVDLMDFSTSESNIHLLESQPAEHPNDSLAPKITDKPQTDKEELANYLSKAEGLYSESFRNLNYEEQKVNQSKTPSEHEISLYASLETMKEPPEGKFYNLDIAFEPPEDVVEQKEPVSDHTLPRTNITSLNEKNQLEPNDVNNLTTENEKQSLSWFIPLPETNLDDLNSVSVGLKVNRQITPSRGNEVKIIKYFSNESKTPNNVSNRVEFLKQSTSDLPRENIFSPDSLNKSAKSCSWNSKGVKKLTENDASNTNQRTFFLRWQVMVLIIAFFVLILDWNYLIERFDKNL